MSKIFKSIFIVLFISSLTLLQAQVRNAEFEIHNRGMLWETMKDNGTIGAPDPTNRFEYYPSMDWPGGPETMSKDDQRSYMVGAGMWVGGKQGGAPFFNENGPFVFVDQGTFDAITKTDNFIEHDDYDYTQAEQTITAHWTTTNNISVTRVSRAWSFSGLNNFILLDYTFTNEGSTELTEVYFGFPYLIRPSYQDFVVHNGWGDDFNRVDELVRFDEQRKLLYAYDYTPNYSLPSDVGNYWDDQDELRTPGYAGYALIYNDPVYGGGAQPANVLFAQLLNNERFLTIQSSNADAMYNILNGTDRSLQSTDPEKTLTPFMLMSVGPYTLSAGESVHIVLVEAVDGISIDDAVEGIDAQELLSQGEDMLKATIDRAANLYANNYVVSQVPPPSPNIEIIPLPESQSISITWHAVEENWIDPIENKNNFMEYRVYRSSRSYIGPFEMVKRIRPNRSTDVDRYWDAENDRWLYEDRTISLGAGYYYAVTSVDSNNVESYFTNLNADPIYATRAPAANTLDVTVFPNPFREISGFPISGQENSIVWTNLPERCTIRIYTSSGELVRTLEHNNALSGEEVWDQLSNARQRTAPGIYFWTVDSPVGMAKGTLLIIK